VVCVVSNDCVAVIFKGLTLKMVSQSSAHLMTHQHISKDLNLLPDCSENLTYLNGTDTCLLSCVTLMCDVSHYFYQTISTCIK